MPKYTVRWSKKTVPGRAERQFDLLGGLRRPKEGKPGRRRWVDSARAFAQRLRRQGFKKVTIYDAYSGKSKPVT